MGSCTLDKEEHEVQTLEISFYSNGGFKKGFRNGEVMERPSIATLYYGSNSRVLVEFWRKQVPGFIGTQPVTDLQHDSIHVIGLATFRDADDSSQKRCFCGCSRPCRTPISILLKKFKAYSGKKFMSMYSFDF